MPISSQGRRSLDRGKALPSIGGGKLDQPMWEPVWPDRSGLVISGDAKALTTIDLNQDGLLDFVASVNDNAPVACEYQPPERTVIHTIRLQARSPNATAIGARVTVQLRDGTRQMDEVPAGGGYLSQSSTTLAFGAGATNDREIERIEVRWPDGSHSSHKLDGPAAQRLVIQKP